MLDTDNLDKPNPADLPDMIVDAVSDKGLELQEIADFARAIGNKMLTTAVLLKDDSLLPNGEGITDQWVHQMTYGIVRETGIRKATAELEKHRDIDPLTGLLNRGGWDQALQAAERRIGQVPSKRREVDTVGVVLYIDLDAFKDINDTYGHSAGDEVLVEMAARLICAVRSEDTVARLGGDEFGVLLQVPVVRDGETIESKLGLIETKFTSLLTGRYELDSGIKVDHSASVGGALLTSATDGETASRIADLNMYHAKSQRKAIS